MMTAYRNFIQDWPERCRRLLLLNFKNAKRNDLEVTLLLSIAASGLIVPYARLSEAAHPSGDAARFEEAKNRLDQVLDAQFLSSKLHPGAEPGAWRFGKLKELRGDPDAWDMDCLLPLTDKKKVRPLVKVLRNALAHGNVFTRGWPHIETLVFLSRISNERPELGYNCLTVSPIDFKEFVLNWLHTLSQASIPGQIFTEADLFAEFVA
jgi:hypothetical protein